MVFSKLSSVFTISYEYMCILKRDRVTEALAKVIDSRKRIKIDIVDIVCIAGTISGLFGFF